MDKIEVNNPDMGKKIFQTASDKNVSNKVIYMNPNDETDLYAYIDPECTIKYNANELIDAYIKGSIVVKGLEGSRYICGKPASLMMKSNSAGIIVGMGLVAGVVGTECCVAAYELYSSEYDEGV